MIGENVLVDKGEGDSGHGAAGRHYAVGQPQPSPEIVTQYGLKHN